MNIENNNTNTNSNTQNNLLIKDNLSSNLLKKGIIEEITNSLTSTEKIDYHVEQYINEMSESFIDNVLEYSCIYAQHKKSESITSDDVVLSMAKLYNIQDIGKNSTFFNNLKSIDINKSMTVDHKKRLEITKEDNKNILE